MCLPAAKTNRKDGDGGNDTLFGAGSKDVLVGGSRDDVVDGGDGNDRIDGGRGDDVITGWGASDVIALCATPGGEPFRVTAVSFGFYDNFANLETDVAIGLSSDQFIILLDVPADSDGNPLDWIATVIHAEAANADNFIRPSAENCAIDVDIL